MAAYAAGDQRAWEPLFDRLAPRLLALFQRCLQDSASAEQHLQATFVELHRSRRSYRVGTPFRRWVFALAIRVRVGEGSCRDRLGADPHQREAPPILPDEGPVERRVRQAIDTLTSGERTLIHLHRFERMSFEEIAEVIGSSEAVVRRQLLGAYHELRGRLWTPDGGGAGP
jgi:RNA polymerase sigma-70 factor (ECF subfamily)